MGQSRAQGRDMSVKVLFITTSSLACLWLLFVSQSFHFTLSEALEEAPLPVPLGSTPPWHPCPWCEETEPFPFGGTRTKTGSGDYVKGFCMKEVCLVRATSTATKIVVERN